MYDSLCIQYTLSKNAILDLRDEEEFEQLIQNLLKANYGMDWNLWWELVEWNFHHRGTDERMNLEEEGNVIVEIVKLWLEREEAGKLLDIKRRVMEFREYLNRIKIET
jgi:hypothetical protein